MNPPPRVQLPWSPALAGGFLTTALQGKFWYLLLIFAFCVFKEEVGDFEHNVCYAFKDGRYGAESVSTVEVWMSGISLGASRK